VEAIAGRILAAGVLIGTYSRGEAATNDGATHIAVGGDPATI
jgi:hypothetical protein